MVQDDRDGGGDRVGLPAVLAALRRHVRRLSLQLAHRPLLRVPRAGGHRDLAG